jgi:hypothetical protein
MYEENTANDTYHGVLQASFFGCAKHLGKSLPRHIPAYQGGYIGMRRTFLNLVIAASCFAILTFFGALRPIASVVVALVVLGLLEIQNALSLLIRSFPALPCSYKAEIVIIPDFRQLMNHETVRGYYEKALQKIGRPDMLIPSAGPYDNRAEGKTGEYALWSAYQLRFLVINNLFWSDYHKTFLKTLRFHTRILDYDFSPDEKEPYLDVEIKNGLLRFWFSPGEEFSEKKPHLICEFPLFIYEDIPRDAIGMKYGSKGWKDYLLLRKPSLPPLDRYGVIGERKVNQSLKIRSESLDSYGFSPHSDYGFATDSYEDRDGDLQIFDFDGGFEQYKNKYLVIKVKEYLDEL